MSSTTFAVASISLRQRADVGYVLAGGEVKRWLARSKFPLATIGSLVDSVDYGSSERATENASGIPMIRMNNMQDGEWDLSDLKYVPLDGNPKGKHLLRVGDLVVTRTNGSRELVGKSAVWGTEGEWLFASYLLRLRVNNRKALPAFLSAVLNSELGRLQIERVSRQIAVTNINPSELRAIEVPLPTPAEQAALLKPLNAARNYRDDAARSANDRLAGVADIALSRLGVTTTVSAARTSFAVKGSMMRSTGRLDPASFDPNRIKVRSDLAGSSQPLEPRLLAAVVDIISERGDVAANQGYIGLADVESMTGQLVQGPAGGPIPPAGLLFESGDILFSRLRPRLNKVWHADRAGVCSTEFRVLRAKDSDSTDSAYVALVLRSGLTLAQTVPLTSGNTHPRLSDLDINDLLIPMGPLDLQRAAMDHARVITAESVALSEKAAAFWDSAKADFLVALVAAAA